MNARRLPPLTALRAFEAAARHRSFKHAAAELSLTPTAISHQVRQLEEQLGVRLFARGARRVDLTQAGQTLFPALRDGFDAIARAVDIVRPRTQSRTVVLSTTLAFASRWLLQRLQRFATSHPSIALHLHTSDAPVDLQGVLRSSRSVMVPARRRACATSRCLLRVLGWCARLRCECVNWRTSDASR